MNQSLLIFCIYHTKLEKYPLLISHLTRKKQVILLTITDGEKWHYTAVTRLSGLLRGVTGK